MAEAHFEVNGTVLGDDPGFQIGAGVGAGFGGGTAWDFFARAGIEDPRRLYTTVSELLIAELARHARRELDAQYTHAIEIFEFVAPIAAITAYDLGEMASEEILQPANQSVAPFLKAFSQRVALYTLDKLVELGAELVSSALMDALSLASGQTLGEADRQSLEADIQSAMDILGGDEFEIDSVIEALTPVINILTRLAPDLAEDWQNELALLWSAAVTGRALRRSAAKAGATINVLGLGAAVSGAALSIPPAPDAIAQAYMRRLGVARTEIGFDDVIDFLSDQSIGPLLEQYVPMVHATLGTVAETLGISIGDLVEAALTGAVGEDLTQTDLYVQMRDYCKTEIDGIVLQELIPEMRVALQDVPDAQAYIDDVIVPTLHGLSDFSFDSLDELVGGMTVAEFDLFNPAFKTGLADLVWQFFSRNVVFLTDILMDKAVDELNAGFITLEAQARGPAGDAMTDGALTLGTEVFPGFSPVNPEHVDALRDLVADLLGAGATAFGPAIWTPARRNRLKTLTQTLLDRKTVIDYSRHDEVNDVLTQLSECYYVSDAVNLARLLEALANLTAEEFRVVMERVVPALEIFFLRITGPALAEVEARVVSFIGGLADRLREIEQALEDLAEALEDIAQDLAGSRGIVRHRDRTAKRDVAQQHFECAAGAGFADGRGYCARRSRFRFASNGRSIRSGQHCKGRV
jgi:hypothetical protein